MDAEPEVVELTYDECLARLATESIGRIAVIAEPYPLVFPANYRLVDGGEPGAVPGHTWIALRTRPGNPIDRAPMFVAFEIDGIERTNRAGWSVLVTGTMHRIAPDAAEFDVRFDPEPWVTEGRDRWLVVQPTHITGRRLGGGNDSWAFPAAAYL